MGPQPAAGRLRGRRAVAQSPGVGSPAPVDGDGQPLRLDQDPVGCTRSGEPLGRGGHHRQPGADASGSHRCGRRAATAPCRRDRRAEPALPGPRPGRAGRPGTPPGGPTPRPPRRTVGPGGPGPWRRRQRPGGGRVGHDRGQRPVEVGEDGRRWVDHQGAECPGQGGGGTGGGGRSRSDGGPEGPPPPRLGHRGGVTGRTVAPISGPGRRGGGGRRGGRHHHRLPGDVRADHHHDVGPGHAGHGYGGGEGCTAVAASESEAAMAMADASARGVVDARRRHVGRGVHRREASQPPACSW